MNESNISRAQIILPITVLLGLVLSYFLGTFVAQENYRSILLAMVGIGLTAWAVFGRSIWWFPMFFFPALGGTFFVGFKIHVHEVALLLAIAPLIFTLAMNRSELQLRKHGLQTIVLLLMLYLSFHLFGCLAYLKVVGQAGFGNVIRRYADAMWPLLFLAPFLFYGNTKHLRWAFHLMFFASLARFAIGIYSAYTSGPDSTMVYIPLINFLPAGANSSSDLRTSAPMLVSLVIVYFCIHRNIILRFALLVLIAIGCWGTFLGGSRLTLLSTILLIGFPLVIYRRLGALFLILTTFAIGIGFLNGNPEALYSMPESGRRAASALMFNRAVATDTAKTESSDQWHFRLIEEGWKSWTENFQTILIGRGTRAFEERAWQEGQNFEGMVEMAVVTSLFEKGIWDVLCTFGIVGLFLNLCCMFLVISRCMAALMRRKISSYALGLAFIGAFQCISWLLLCWIGGSFPSAAIMTGLIALIAIEDEEARKAIATTVAEKQEPAPAIPRSYGRPILPIRH